MKSNALSAAQRQLMVKIIKQQVEEHMEDVSKRSQYLWAMSMLAAGLSPKTVMKVKDKLPLVTEKYAELRTDELADFAFCSKLNEAGCSFEMTEHEM